MNLQKKTILVFVILLISVLIVISIFFSTILLASYSTLEEQYIAKDLDQSVKKLDDEFSTLSAIVSDWGPWDDTYNFVNGNDPEYIRSNLLTPGFDNLDMNLIVLTNNKGAIVYSGSYDPLNKVMVPVPAFFQGHLSLTTPLMNMSDPHYITAGILMLPENPMIIVSQPIVHSDFSGEPQGVVIMGRYLDKAEISKLAELTQPSLAFISIEDPSLSPDLLSRIREKSGSLSRTIKQISMERIAGYALIKDIYGNDALVLQITEARDIYRQGLNTTIQVILIIIFSGLCLGLVVIFLLDRILLKRMRSISTQVYSIGKSGSTTEHVGIEGDDELSGLATEINRMLDTIEQAQQKVQASEARFRGLAENLPLIIFEMDTTGNLLYVNKTGVEIFGVTEEKINQGINIRDYLSLENIEMMERGLAAVLSGARSPGETYTLKQLDGNLMHAIVNTSLIYSEGNIIGFRGIVLDISERLKLERDLKESEEEYRALTENTSDILFSLNMSGFFTYISPQVNKYGYLVDEILGKTFRDIIYPSDFNTVEKDFARDLEKGAQFHSTFRILDKWGNTHWFEEKGTLRLDQYGTPIGIYGVLRDDSLRKRVEEQLTESKNLYMAIFDNTGSATIIISKNTSIILANERWARLTGISKEDCIGRSWTEFVYPEDQDMMKKYHYDRRDESSFVPREYLFRLIDSLKNVHSCIVSVVMIPGTTDSIAAVVDISERKRAEDAIELANRKLNLMNNITRHDILNTITGLLGCVDMANATTSPEEKKHLLDDIKELTRIIERQIAFTREYQEVGVHLPLWQNIHLVIDKVLQNFENTGIHFQIDTGNIEVYADPLLEKVFYNLIDNAKRYGEKITTIRIFTRVTENNALLIFEDDGAGIPFDQKTQIFERGVGKNTGMGLFLTQEILAITGVTIEEDGIFGSGARFEMTVPNWAYRTFV